MSYTYQKSIRKLSPEQLKLPFFSRALENLSTALEGRDRRLFALQQQAGSERKTRREIFEALEAVAEHLLVRLDLATGILGWTDKDGRIRVCSQRQLAVDAGLSTSALSRLFGRLHDCGYVVRRTRKISRATSDYTWSVKGETLIQFTEKFFRHLGVWTQWCRVSKWARKKAKRKMLDLGARGLLPAQKAQKKLADDRKRREKQSSFRRWLESSTRTLEAEYAQRRVRLQLELLAHRKGLDRSEFDALVERELAKRFPDYLRRKAILERL